jgi:hypothetical protein
MVYLDPFAAEDIANSVVELVESEGFSPGESIPGLIDAIVQIADGDDELLDAAANYLADGGTIGQEK